MLPSLQARDIHQHAVAVNRPVTGWVVGVSVSICRIHRVLQPAANVLVSPGETVTWVS